MSEKNRLANLKRWKDPEYKSRVSKRMAEVNSSPEQRKKNRGSHIGKQMPEGFGEKVSAGLKGIVHSQVSNEKRRKTQTGRKLPPRSESWCANLSKAKKGKAPPHFQTQEVIRKRTEKLIGVKHSEERKKAESKGQLKAILNGKSNPQNNYLKVRKTFVETTKGGKICCHSSWEVVYTNYLENSKEVTKFEKDKIRIPYLLEERSRVYIPDFLVTLSTGNIQLIEVKPSELLLSDKETLAKITAAKIWCQKNSIEFLTVDESEITRLLSDAHQVRKIIEKQEIIDKGIG